MNSQHTLRVPILLLCTGMSLTNCLLAQEISQDNFDQQNSAKPFSMLTWRPTEEFSLGAEHYIAMIPPHDGTGLSYLAYGNTPRALSETILEIKDPYVIQKSCWCSDMALVESKLKAIVGEFGLQIVETGVTGAFKAILPEGQYSENGDVVDLDLEWSKEEPGKSIVITITCRRLQWFNGRNVELRVVDLTPVDITRFYKLQGAVMKLQDPVEMASVGTKPTGSVTPTPTQ